MIKYHIVIILTLVCCYSFGQNTPIKPNAFNWADYPENYVGKTIVLNAYYSNSENEYVIYQQDRRGGGYKRYKDLFTGKWETDFNRREEMVYYCYKTFSEEKTRLKVVVNVPQKFWDNDGRMIPKTLGAGLYKLTLSVSSEKPQGVCDGDWVSGSGSNRIFYTLVAISRYNL
jgi:hypothetical protein